MRKILRRITFLSLVIGISFSSCAVKEKADVLEASDTNTVPEVLVIKNSIIGDANPESLIESSRPVVTDEDVDLLALVTMAEAEGESEYGQRLVIDTILNRVDHEKFPDTIKDVIYQKNAFTSMWNGRVDRCVVRDDIRQLVIEELESRTNSDIIFFMAGQYSIYGTPLFQEGNHYFSSY